MAALTPSRCTTHCGVQRPPRYTPVPALGATTRPRQPIQARAAATSPDTGLQRATKVRINTRSNCELSISVYPTFAYNAFGGGGEGTVEPRPDGTLFLRFNPSTLSIPDLSFRSTTMFGIPMPPPLNIAIQPLRLEGTLYPATGEVALDFDAEFKFTLGSLYAAPSLLVNTALTTEFSAGRLKSATGQRLVGNSGTLVGVSNVPKTGDLFVDTFLLLPTDALAILSCDFEFYP